MKIAREKEGTTEEEGGNWLVPTVRNEDAFIRGRGEEEREREREREREACAHGEEDRGRVKG